MTFKETHIICGTDTLLNGLTRSKWRAWTPAQETNIFGFYFEHHFLPILVI